MDIQKAFSESHNELICELRRIMGVEKTISLVDNFGGTYIHIPMLKSLFRNDRNALIYADFEKGYSFQNLAIKYSLTASTIRQIVSKERKAKTSIRSKESTIKESNNETIIALKQAIGISSTLSIIEALGGFQIYIPQKDTVLREEREICIYNDFNKGLSFKELAIRYSVSATQVRYIVKKKMKKGKNKRDRP